MLKNQRQNLVMENEFHIKEERVKAQQSSVRTHEVAKKEPSSKSNSESSAVKKKNNGEKVKEINSGKDIVRKTAVRDEVAAPPPTWDIAPSDPASSSTSQPVSGTTTPSSVVSGGEKVGARLSSPSVHNGPVGSGASPKSGQRRLPVGSPDPSAEKGKSGGGDTQWGREVGVL